MSEAETIDLSELIRHLVDVAERAPSPEKATAAIERELANSGASERDISLAFSTLINALQERLKHAALSDVVVCNFCQKSQKEVKTIVQGPTASICNECIAICAETIGSRSGLLRKLFGRR